MDRRYFLSAASAALLAPSQASCATARPQEGRHADEPDRAVVLGAVSSANADGSGERKFLQNAVFEYHARLRADGKWVLFTSERNGLGQSDIFRARADGTGIEPLVTGPSVDDAAVLSPDGSRLAFVSSRSGFRANIWTLDLKTQASCAT